MKKLLLILGILVFCTMAYSQAQNVTLDEAISNAVQQVQSEIARNQSIIVYQFSSPYKMLSDHILKELFDNLVKTHKFIVLDRTMQKVIDAEYDYQYRTSEGYISDESLASLTKRIGAQAILTGSLDDSINYFSFRVKVIGTETTKAIASFTANVDKKDIVITGFRRKIINQNLLTGAKNIAFGLGSYLEGDTIGGITISAGYALAAGLIIIEVAALDWDSPAVSVPGTIGLGVAGLSLAYGFARPFIYNRAPHIAAILDNAKTSIVMVSDAFGNRSASFQAAYTIKF